VILKITIQQRGKKIKEIEGRIIQQIATLETMRKIWEAEQTLNSLPGTDLRWHFNITDEGSL